jgi:hypothetical protein
MHTFTLVFITTISFVLLCDTLFLMANKDESNSTCLTENSLFGLYPNMSIVQGAVLRCNSREDCLKKLCYLNDYPGVSYVMFNVN